MVRNIYKESSGMKAVTIFALAQMHQLGNGSVHRGKTNFTWILVKISRVRTLM